MKDPINLLKTWLEEEKTAGSELASHAVLSTKGIEGNPRGRIVAIREVTPEWILFFTQKRTRKVQDIKNCSQVALTFWFERYAREVMVEGSTYLLSAAQNAEYWNNYSRQGQIRFCSYAPTSGLAIEDKKVLEEKRIQLEQQFKDTSLPLSEDYCGIAVKPERFVFYTYRLDELSDVWEYQRTEDTTYIQRRLSP
jgi:pyridoxamine 5'-phosphate oxidase